jgi:hypothetical protein
MFAGRRRTDVSNLDSVFGPRVLGLRPLRGKNFAGYEIPTRKSHAPRGFLVRKYCYHRALYRFKFTVGFAL